MLGGRCIKGSLDYVIEVGGGSNLSWRWRVFIRIFVTVSGRRFVKERIGGVWSYFFLGLILIFGMVFIILVFFFLFENG